MTAPAQARQQCARWCSAQPRCWPRSRACAAAVDATAQTPAATRIGYVDMKRLLDNAPQVVAGRQKLEKEFGPRDASLKTDEKRLDDLRQRQLHEARRWRRPTPRRSSAKSTRSTARSSATATAMRNDLKSRSDQELDKSWREINDAVVDYAREQGYDIDRAEPGGLREPARRRHRSGARAPAQAIPRQARRDGAVTTHTLGDIAARFGLELRGDAATRNPRRRHAGGRRQPASSAFSPIHAIARSSRRRAPMRSCCAPPTPTHSRAPR